MWDPNSNTNSDAIPNDTNPYTNPDTSTARIWDTNSNAIPDTIPTDTNPDTNPDTSTYRIWDTNANTNPATETCCFIVSWLFVSLLFYCVLAV